MLTSEQDESAALVFDGLDTFCTVSLNGKVILESRNMFVPARVDVTEVLVAGENKLVLDFESSVLRGKMIEEELGVRHFNLGHSSRVYVRMQQSKYGWDWVRRATSSSPGTWLT